MDVKKKASKYKSRTPDKNGFVDYPEQEHQTWAELYQQQMQVIEGRACDEFIQGLDLLNFSPDRIPQCQEISDVLRQATGWSVAPVSALIPPKDFFDLLAHKKFPAATFIRTPEEIDYLQEPDIFHEFFGHCPLLTNPAYAEFVYEYGKRGLVASSDKRNLLLRLFWFTIEFGLLQTADGLRIYGGGILSSKQETIYALDKNSQVLYKPLHAPTALRTPYRIDKLQPLYFLLQDMNQLFSIFDDNLDAAIDEALAKGDNPVPEGDVNFC